MAVSIRLKQFDGPLDLLLTLIGKAKIEIKDIFVSEITDQYIEAVRTAEDFNMEEASEFIAMAATLVEIKSRSILPQKREQDEEDPEQALILRLEEYKRFKESADRMTDFERSARQVFGKLPEEYPLPPPSYEIEGLTLQSLWDALWRIAERRPKELPEVDMRMREIRRDSYTVEGCMAAIDQRLAGGSFLFDALFSPCPSREEVVTLFLALLETLKLGKAHVSQSAAFDEMILIPGRKTADGDQGDTGDSGSDPVRGRRARRHTGAGAGAGRVGTGDDASGQSAGDEL